MKTIIIIIASIIVLTTILASAFPRQEKTAEEEITVFIDDMHTKYGIHIEVMVLD